MTLTGIPQRNDNTQIPIWKYKYVKVYKHTGKKNNRKYYSLNIMCCKNYTILKTGEKRKKWGSKEIYVHFL